MTLDESKESDKVFNRDGVSFVVDKELLEEAQPITVDYVTTPAGEGFTITSGFTQSEGCGGGCC